MNELDKISDRTWALLAPHSAGKAGDVGRTAGDNRLFLNAALVEELGAAVVIPSKKNRLVQRAIDRNLYRDRNKVARFFSHLKQFRRLATRYDKTACSFLGMLHFVSALLWLR